MTEYASMNHVKENLLTRKTFCNKGVQNHMVCVSRNNLYYVIYNWFLQVIKYDTTSNVYHFKLVVEKH